MGAYPVNGRNFRTLTLKPLRDLGDKKSADTDKPDRAFCYFW
jgi:hypothetical protein